MVAVESSLHPLFIGSFNRLGVAPPGLGCRPFDQQRGGFVIAEAAAAVCLEGDLDEPPTADDPRVIACVERFACGADATHLTSGDPDGFTLGRVLSRVIDNRPLDLIHAHGTGTLANDPIELHAIEQSLLQVGGRQHSPVLYSHKGAIGHSLGAAGLVAVAINCLCHRNGVVPPNVCTARSAAHARRVASIRQLSVPCLPQPSRRRGLRRRGGGGVAGFVTRVIPQWNGGT